ncbi:MAG: carboxypeptidase regulatory-like domain-containing protein [bacterium]|nr:carboxypeptidase regulatory-like domain-containing protein [bacterium]
MRPHPGTPRTAARALAALLIALAGASARAATVVVEARERDGRPVSELSLTLREKPAEAGTMWGRFSTRTVVTDASGRAIWGDVPPGTHTVRVAGATAHGYVDPDANPQAPPPSLTVVDEEETVGVDLVLWRGARVVARLDVDRGELPRTQVRFFGLQTGQRIVAPPNVAGEVERVLLPGRWNLSVEPPPGYLLVGLEIDGVDDPGHQAVLELDEYSPTTHVRWLFAAPATISGRVTKETDASGPLDVVAHLVEPGPWIEAARARGGSVFDVVQARWVAPRLYEMVVPSGRWVVRPEGPRLIESSPAEVELALEPGGAATQDFLVRHEDSSGSGLSVRVMTPDHGYIKGASVEVWARETRDGEPQYRVDERETELFRAARFYDLPPGNYVVYAAHPDYLETSIEINDYEPLDGELVPARVVLERGAEIDAHATDEDGKPVAGVELEVQRLAELPMRIEDAELRALKMRARRDTDATGRAKIVGLYSGAHRIHARLRGEQAVRRFVRIALPDGGHGESLDLHLGEGESATVELAVLPAASVAGSLVCHDHRALPVATSVRVFDLAARFDVDDPDLERNAALAHDDLPLSGGHSDDFLAGPLETGGYHVALRPVGFSYWTWVMGTERHDEALAVQTDKGGTTDLGIVEIDCSPTIDVLPLVVDGGALPEPDDIEVEASVLAAEQTDDPGAIDVRIDRRGERILIRDLPQGKTKVELRITHPHFLPEAALTFEYEHDLQRGAAIADVLEIVSIGGSIRLLIDAPAARLIGPEGPGRIARSERGAIEFPSIPPGAYRVEACADPECTEIARVWESQRVVSGETLRLR